MSQLDILKLKLENQIEECLATIVVINGLEKQKPWRELSKWHKKAWAMILTHILHRSIWNKFELHNIPPEKRIEEITAVSKATHEHFKTLYGFDTKEEL